MDEKAKVISFISICKKSGNIKSGEFAVMEAIKSESAKLVIVASDASDNTKKKFKDKADYRQIEHIEFSEMAELGRAIGKDIAASIAICDSGLARSFLDKYGRYLNGENESI